MEISKKIENYIYEQRLARFATCGKGKPHVVPIAPVYDREAKAVYFVTDYGTRKLENTKENSNVAIVFDSYDRRSHGVLVEGKAKILERGAEYRKVRETLYKKYPFYSRPEYTFEEGEAPIIRIDPSKVVSWGV